MIELNRHPYQAPQTSMERHVLGLVKHLEDGVDSRGGFNKAIESAQEHAFYLEKRCTELAQEVRRLELYMAPSLPSVKCWNKTLDTRDPAEVYPMMGGAIVFEWGMEQMRYRVVWRDGDPADQKTLKQIKRRTYREILAKFRSEFERTWTFNTERRQRDRAQPK
jgi:hypothetical protein